MNHEYKGIQNKFRTAVSIVSSLSATL